MSHSYIDRSSQSGLNQSNESNQPQRKIAPVAQLKVLNDDRVRDWGLFDNYPAQMFAIEGVQQNEDESPTDNIESVEQTTPRHGVTNSTVKLTYTIKNGKPLKKSKEVDIPAEKELVIKGGISGETIVVSVEVEGNMYEGVALKSAVNISPNSLDEIDTEDKKNIVRETASGSGWDKKATDVCHINYGNDLPQVMYICIDNELNKHVSSGQVLSAVNKTVTLPVKFDNLSYVADLADTDREKYANKTFIYRFTRFNNGNTKDVILVEELAENFVRENLSEEEKNSIDFIFAEHGLSFIEPGAEAANADTELRLKLGKASASEIEALHAKAYLPLTDTQKEAVMSGVAKLPESALKDIQGLKFGKKFCKLDDNNKSIAATPAPNAYYSPNDHEVILVVAETSIVGDLFGDKDGGNFIDRLEFTVLHEIGHAVDYAHYHKDKDNLLNPMYEKYDKYKAAVEEKENARTAYNNFVSVYNADKNMTNKAKLNKLKTDFDNKTMIINQLLDEYKNYQAGLNGKKFETFSGVGNEISVADNSISYATVTDITDFTLALKFDSPNITGYSDKNVKEAYAEAFALYASEPKSLQILSPNVYEYFNNKYPH